MLNENSVEWFLKQCTGCDAAFFKHPDRNTIQEEADFLKKCLARGSRYILSRYWGEWIDGQMAEIKDDAEFVDDTLYASTAFIYKDSEQIHKVMKEWWYHISRYHIIDQLALPYVLWKSECRVHVINEKYGEIPYLTYTRKMSNG